MTVVAKDLDLQLRLGPGTTSLNERVSAGVIVIDSIPVGAGVLVRVDRPTELNEVSDALTPQPYAFEHAAPPAVFTANGVTGNRRERVLIQNGNGIMTPAQREPQWAAFAAPVTGSLVQKGRTEHYFTMPGRTGDSPDLDPADRHLLRMRWTGTALGAPENIVVAASGTQKLFTGTLTNRKIAPGTLRITATVGAVAKHFADDGRGRIVGFDTGTTIEGADGQIDYQSGEWRMKFDNGAGGGAPDAASNIVATAYQYNCLYKPLDIHVSFNLDLV